MNCQRIRKILRKQLERFDLIKCEFLKIILNFQIRVNDFKKAIESTMTHFPDSPLIWIKDIAYYINDKLQFEPEDPFFTNKPDGNRIF